MDEPIFKQGSSSRNPLLDPILLVPIMALTLGLVAAWRYWDNPNAFSGDPDERRNGFEDLLTEFEESQRSPEAVAADIDSSQVLSGELRSIGGERRERRRNRNRSEQNNQSEAKSSDEILKLLSNPSKSPTGGGNQSVPSVSIFDGDRGGTRLSLGQFGSDGSFRGRGLSLAPEEQELVRNAALGRFQSVQRQSASAGAPGGVSQSPALGREGFSQDGQGLGVAPGVPGGRSPLPPSLGGAPIAPGYGTSAGQIPGSAVNVPNYGGAAVGQPRSFTTPGYGVSPTVPSVAGSGPLVPSTSGPGYSRGLRNYQLNTAPPANSGFSTGFGGNTGGVGGNRPLRSENGAGALSQPEPAPSNNIGGRSFGSFSNPYSR
ncbi:MAG: hypothetical protein AAF889_13785 [Cyanobacteria bacterium P01_D01_bin.73]